MITELIYLMDVRLLGENDRSCSYYTGSTADCPPLPKHGELVGCGEIAGRVIALDHERESFPGYVVFHLDIYLSTVSESDTETNAVAGQP